MLAACGGEPVDESLRRGHEGERAQLGPMQIAAAYAMALRSAFDLPGTTLLADPRMLAHEGGYEVGDDRLPDDVQRALRATGTIQGDCVPEERGAEGAPACDHGVAGYAIRFSDVYKASGDTLRLHLVAERYRPATDTVGHRSAFRMEERYHLVRDGSRWRVTRKERMRL